MTNHRHLIRLTGRIILLAMVTLAPRVASAAVVAYWQFEPGAVTVDSAGSNSLTNSGVASSGDVATNAPGVGSASFNGAHLFSTTATLDLSGMTDLTVEWFIKSTQSSLAIVVEHGLTNVAGSFGSAINDTFGAPNVIEGYQRTGAALQAYLEKSTTDVLDDEWHHIAVTIDGSESFTDRITLFVDGADVGTYLSVGSPGGFPSFLDATLFIGSRANSSFKYVGLLDELRISDVILTADQFLNASPIPIPAALPLFMSAIAGLGFIARRGRENKPGTFYPPSRISSKPRAV